MRVVHLYKDYFPPVQGGMERTVNRMAHGAVAAGADVTVLTSAHGSRRGSEDRIDGIRVIRCAEWARFASTPVCPSMPARLAGLRADLLHLHFPSPPGEVSFLLTGMRKPAVVTYQSDVVRQAGLLRLYRPAVNAVLDRARVLMPTSPQYIERSEFLRPRRDKCVVVPLGIELEPFDGAAAPDERARVLRQRYGAPLALFVGRFRYYKGLDVLLEAMRRVNGHLVLVGGGLEEPVLRARRAQLGLESRVHFAGSLNQEDLLAHYRAADVCVLPSTHPSEAFGLALVEALASGRPAVSTELGTGTSYVNRDGETGLVVPPGDVAALAGAIGRLFADPALRARLGAAGRARARALFSADRMVRAVLDVYAAVLS